MNTNIKKLTIASALALVIGVTNSYGTTETISISVPVEVDGTSGISKLLVTSVASGAKTVTVNAEIKLRGKDAIMTGQKTDLNDTDGALDDELVNSKPTFVFGTGKIVAESKFADATATLITSGAPYESKTHGDGLTAITNARKIDGIPFLHKDLTGLTDARDAGKIYVDTENFNDMYDTIVSAGQLDDLKGYVIDTVISKSTYKNKNFLEDSNSIRYLEVTGTTSGDAKAIVCSFGDQTYTQVDDDPIFNILLQNKVSLTGNNKLYERGHMYIDHSSEVIFENPNSFPKANITLQDDGSGGGSTTTIKIEDAIETRSDGATTAQTIDLSKGGTVTLTTAGSGSLKLNTGGKLIL